MAELPQDPHEPVIATPEELGDALAQRYTKEIKSRSMPIMLLPAALAYF